MVQVEEEELARRALAAPPPYQTEKVKLSVVGG